MEKYLVYGTGKSGICAAGLLKRQGEDFIFFDENEKLDRDGFFKKNPEFAENKLILGSLDTKTIDSVSTVVISPGVPTDHENVNKLRDAGKKIIGELELGYTYEKGKVIAITGTNGKTTTTSLVGHILKTAGFKTFVAGNIGDPYTQVCDMTDSKSVTVLEVSSFQLETVNQFSPDVCAILNITPDHLDRHKTFENYAQIKLDIAKNLKKKGNIVLNYEDNILREFGENNKSVMFFSSGHSLQRGFYLNGKDIVFSDNKLIDYINVSMLNILGVHNYENAMAAAAICECFGVKRDKIIEALTTFTAVEHRIEFVCERDGVTYYNDSKGTNTDAAIKAVMAMERPIILIGGGYDKKADYTDWVLTFKGRVKHLILIGECARDIAACCERNGFKDYSFEDTFDSAVSMAISRANRGDCVLLSPACASWDMFKNFEERGRIFKELVRG